jgi:hypothetical protein
MSIKIYQKRIRRSGGVVAVGGAWRDAQLSGLSVVEVADEGGHGDVAGTALPLVVAAAASAGGLVVETGKQKTTSTWSAAESRGSSQGQVTSRSHYTPLITRLVKNHTGNIKGCEKVCERDREQSARCQL